MISTKLDFKGAVIGMVMGDGYISKDKRDKGNCSLEFSSSNMEFLKFIESLLNYLTSTKISKRAGGLSKFPNGVYESKERYRVRSKRHPIYTALWEHLYYHGRRTVDEYILKTLSPLGLSILYMSDGTVMNRGGVLGKTSYYKIYTNAYNKAEHCLIQRMLAKRFGIQTAIHKAKGGSDLSLYIKAKSTDRFLDLIEPYIIPSMQYKLGNNVRRALH